MIEQEAAKCNFTLEELQKTRDENGYMNINKKDIPSTIATREKVGNEFRYKEWISTPDGQKYLVKTNAESVDGGQCYLEYAEMICMQLAKKVGIEYADYDLIKVDGEPGVITKCMTNDDEELITLDMLNNGTYEHPDCLNVVEYVDVRNNLNENLMALGTLSKDEIKQINDEMDKRVLFDIFIGAADRHTENISFIHTKDGKLKLAPMYDSENSLGLELDKDTIVKIVENPEGFNMALDAYVPKIGVVPFKECDNKDITEATFFYALDSDESFDFLDKLLNDVDIYEVMDEVEEKIGAKLPQEVRAMASSWIEHTARRLDKLQYKTEVNYDYDYMDKATEEVERRRKAKEDKQAPSKDEQEVQ